MKTVLITGGGKGIGAAMARQFAKADYKVLINVRKPSDEAITLVKDIEQTSCHGKGLAEIAEFDVCDIKACKAWFAKQRTLDVLVNNAGILKDNLLTQTQLEDWQAVINTNYQAPVNLFELAEPLLSVAQNPCVINIASIAGVKPRQGQGAYAVSKAMIIKWTEQLAHDHPHINSYAISPGPVATEMIKSAPWYTQPKAFDRIPMRRFAEPQEMANAAVFLAQAQLLKSGFNLVMDGGFTHTAAS